jgi:hypothetical protein
MVHYAAGIVAASSVAAQCTPQMNKLRTEPYYVEARGTAATFNPGGRETHFMGIAHDEEGQEILTDEGEPAVGIIATSWNTCVPEILGLCIKGKDACDRYHIEVGDMGAVMSQLPLAECQYERLGRCRNEIMHQHRFIKGEVFAYSSKQMEAAQQKVAEARDRRQRTDDQHQALMQLRAQASETDSKQLVVAAAKIEPATAPTAAKPRGDKQKAAQRVKGARARRKREKSGQSDSNPRRAAPAAGGEEEKQLAHGRPPSHVRPDPRQLKRQKLQAELDALDAEEEPGAQPDRYRSRQPSRYSSEDEQDWRYGRYAKQAPYQGYEGYGPGPGAPEYPHYGPWTGMNRHHAPRRHTGMHQASHRYPRQDEMSTYRQPRRAYDPYEPGPVAGRPRLQVNTRSAGGPSRDDMDDRSDDDNATYEGEGDDDDDDCQEEEA